MVLTDTIADMLTTIRNGLLVQKEKVQTPFSKIKSNVLKVLTEEGYIKDYKIINETKAIKKIEIVLSYINGHPSIKKISKVSKPGRKVYTKIKNFNFSFISPNMKIIY